jgi:hypothetical protein
MILKVYLKIKSYIYFFDTKIIVYSIKEVFMFEFRTNL